MKILKFRNFFSKITFFFETTGLFFCMISHHFAELGELIFKMHAIWGFEIVFHKITEEKGKKF